MKSNEHATQCIFDVIVTLSQKCYDIILGERCVTWLYVPFLLK